MANRREIKRLGETDSSDKVEQISLKRKSSIHEGFRNAIYNPQSSISPTKERVSLDDPLVALDAFKKTRNKKYQKRKALDVPSQPFLNEQEISSKTEELSNIVKNIPQNLLDNLRVKVGNITRKITNIIIGECNRSKSEISKAQAQTAFELDKKLYAIESYHSRPDKTIQNEAKKAISSVLIDAHRLLTDIVPSWNARFPQLQDLHTHIDTELKQLRNHRE